MNDFLTRYLKEEGLAARLDKLICYASAAFPTGVGEAAPPILIQRVEELGRSCRLKQCSHHIEVACCAGDVEARHAAFSSHE